MTKKIFALFAGAALLATGLAFAQMGPRRGAGMGAGAGRHPGWRIARFLQLTPEQQQQLKTIRQEAWTEAQPYVQQLRTAFAGIESQIKSGVAPDTVAEHARALVAQNQQAIESLAAIRARTAARSYAVLTPEQQQKAQQLRQFFGGGFCGMGGFGQGFGMGRGPGAGPAAAPAPATPPAAQ